MSERYIYNRYMYVNLVSNGNMVGGGKRKRKRNKSKKTSRSSIPDYGYTNISDIELQ